MNNTSLDTRERRGVRNTHNIISIIFLSLLAVMAFIFSITLLIKNATLQREEEAVRSELEALNNEGYYTETETRIMLDEAKKEAEEKTKKSFRDMIQQKLEAGEGTTATIRSLFPDQIVVASAGRYYFFPISDQIEHHGFRLRRPDTKDRMRIIIIGTKSAVKAETIVGFLKTHSQ